MVASQGKTPDQAGIAAERLVGETCDTAMRRRADEIARKLSAAEQASRQKLLVLS
jgi:hypothetical protein